MKEKRKIDGEDLFINVYIALVFLSLIASAIYVLAIQPSQP